MEASTVSVRHRADLCLDQFRTLLEIEAEVRGSSRTNEIKSDELRAEDQRARFEMWAGNIGAFADGHASLDYRLRDTEDARELMVEFLRTLWDFLRRAIDALRLDQILDSDSEPIPAASYACSSSDIGKPESSAISSSFQGTETESVWAAVPAAVSSYGQKLQSVERTIDRLYRLSFAIRQPSITRQNTKAEKSPVIDDEGNNIDSEFEEYALQVTTHRFPEAPKELRERLARGILIRRKRFLYRQSHQEKLKLRTATTVDTNEERKRGAVSDIDTATTVRGFRVFAEPPVQGRTDGREAVGIPILPSQTSASTVIKDLIHVEKIKEDEESKQSTIFTNPMTKTSPVLVPDAPKLAPGSKEFECPYCCIILPISHAKASKWRRHVLEDLEPYNCVFENCSDHRLFFQDKNSWISHMRSAHTTRWLCKSTNHDPCSFQTEQDYDAHMWTVHTGSFTKAQLPLLRKRSKVPTSVTFRECPLCGFKPHEAELRRETQVRGMTETSQEEVEKIASDRIIKHLSIHLESLAVTALPWLDTVEDIQSERAKSEITDESTEQEENDSLASHGKRSDSAFLENEFGDEGPLMWSDESDTTGESSSNASYGEEWGFIPWQDYYGHDRDPILQTLLRKLYLDTSPFPGSPRGPQGPKLPLYYVPRDQDTNFFARGSALNDIEEVLCSITSKEKLATKPPSFPRCFVVYGPGGMGKTQIAAQFVATHRSQFDAVLWINAENSTKILQDLNGIAIDLGLVSRGSIDATDQSFTRDMVKRWLVSPLKSFDRSSPSYKEKASWLLVFDGVEDGEILNEFWPYDGPGSILVTSRNPHSWTTSRELKPFSINEATEYLLKLTDRDASKEEKVSAAKIAARLGGLPLALAQMGAIITHRSLSFGEFLRFYEERGSQQELLDWNINHARPQLSNYGNNVASVWAFDSLGKGARILLNVLSMLDPDRIPERLFDRAVVEGDPIDIAELKRDYRTARNELLTRSLVTRNRKDKSLFIHRLVQDVTRVRVSNSELRKIFFDAVRLVSGEWPFALFRWRHSVDRWSACEELLSHVERLKDLFPEITPSVDSFEDYQFARLLVDAGWYRHERGKSAEAILFNNMAQSICESTKLRLLENPEYAINESMTVSDVNSSLVEINHNRGCIALEMNEPRDALKYHKLFNNMMVKDSAGKASHDDMRLAISWNERGNAYMLNRKWVKGEKCFLKAIEEMEKLDNFERTMLSLPLANLGLAYWLQRKYDEALRTLEEGLRDREDAFGLDDRVSFITGRFLHALGNVKGSQGHEDEGLKYHRRTLLHYKSTLGNRHHRTADVFVKVAEHNIRLQQYEMALALLDHSLGAYSNAHHFAPEKIRASFKRAQALRRLQRVDEADSELLKCFKLYNVLYTNLVRNVGAKEEHRKVKATDLRDADVDELIAFWSK
ncbi:hypothetical protein EV356DRAFT_324935 [Viridothelium virens]|uniref:Uncharacterized protein n=1 Tax=Viridothelium virens TaxID=1048519 RepID=A0A6A6GYA0_VIRVR|nr:hypothetical protein EV356DRAFT_324935 [Viridothelium virens]